VRSEKKAKETIAKLEEEGIRSGQLFFLELELSDPRKAKQAAESFLSLETRLDILSTIPSERILCNHC
jgi:hypothetical protein